MPTVSGRLLGSKFKVAYKQASSKAALRAYIQAGLAIVLSICLFGLACFAYILFYLNYIPQVGLETPVHLIYGQIQNKRLASRMGLTQIHSASAQDVKFLPHGITKIPSSVLMHNQAYDVYVHLTLPTSPHNMQAGSFMINLTLFDGNPETSDYLATSRRPARLTYKSNMINTMDTLMKSPFYLSGLTKEQEKLKVLLLEKQVFAKNRVPNFLAIQVGNDNAVEKAPEAYESKVYFRARFRGLRYFMYNHRIIAFITFTGAFWLTEMFWAVAAWSSISAYLFTEDAEDEKDDDDDLGEKKNTTTAQSSGSERRGVHPLAPIEDDSEEIPRPRSGVYATPEATPAPEGELGDDEDDYLEDISNDRSDEGGRTPTSIDENTMQGSAQDSGIGTSMSEQRDEGLVRRRSQRKE
ncbi:Seipin [Arthrobotrys entomopaga]|nr:Seipin [Arthrobotrys entomopaga]